MKLQIIEIYIVTKTTFEKNLNKKFLFLNIKDFLFFKYICEIYKLQNIRFSKKCEKQTDGQSDSQRSSAPNNMIWVKYIITKIHAIYISVVVKNKYKNLKMKQKIRINAINSVCIVQCVVGWHALSSDTQSRVRNFRITHLIQSLQLLYGMHAC